LTVRKYEKSNKNLASFYIFGYLLELRIESGDFQKQFPILATRKLKKHSFSPL
jgi:hypothetical protein